MLDFISYDIVEGWVRAINNAFGINIPERTTAIVFLIFAALIIIFCILKFIFNPYFWNRKWRKKQLNVILKGYGHYTSWWQRWLYIDTWLQKESPNDFPEPFESQFQDFRTNKNAISFFIKNVLRENNDHSPHYCILGGSGMGKSTFVVNLVRNYINKYRERNLPYPIRLINCGDIIQLTDFIKDIDNKENTVLILDALDENNEAIDNYNEFLKQFLYSIINFRIVIITCRTQFFEKYEDELHIISEQTHEPDTKKAKHFRKYYVSPFNSEEINKYLNKKYLLRFSAKKKAKSIVKKCNKLMARPLLLSYIDDLLNSDIENFNYSIARIYEIIIDKWLEREANFVTTKPEENKEYKKKLLDFSYEMALCLAKPSFDQSEVEAIIKQYSKEKFIKEGYLKGRSLLNRNSKNDYKFAHKSFMEYLVARQIFEQNGTVELESIDCKANDMIPHFLSNLIKCHYPLHNNLYYYVTIGKVFSFSSDLEHWRRRDIFSHFRYIRNIHHIGLSIQVLCNVSDNIIKYLSAFFKILEDYYNSSFSRVEIMIDCARDFYKIKDEIIKSFGNHHTTYITLYLQNFDFRSISHIRFILSLASYSEIQLKEIVFIRNLNNPSDFHKEVITSLNNLESHPSLLSRLNILLKSTDIFSLVEEHDLYQLINVYGHFCFNSVPLGKKIKG